LGLTIEFISIMAASFDAACFGREFVVGTAESKANYFQRFWKTFRDRDCSRRMQQMSIPMICRARDPEAENHVQHRRCGQRLVCPGYDVPLRDLQ
jgi:hypothetical protein